MRSITKAAPSPVATIQGSLWHSPVPYLFGGLAAMLSLMAFALLILACSYWKINRRMERENRDVEEGKPVGDATKDSMPVFEEKVLVIMAGDAKPTFLATPISNNTCNNDNNNEKPSLDDDGEGLMSEKREEEKSKNEENQ